MSDAAHARADAGVAILVFIVCALYLSQLPYNLGASDEAYFLVEAKRVAGGEVMYRDIFEFIPPGAVYVMAAAFKLAGTTMPVARGTMTLLHALTGVLLFLTCRQLGVARSLAAVAPLAYIGLCHAPWPFASWHWFSSFLLVVQCWVLCRSQWSDTPRAALVPGLVSGALIGVQHQRGLPVAAGVALLLILVHVIARRHDSGRGWATLARQLAMYAAGILAVLVPLMLPSLWLAGMDALIEGLIRFPVETYRPTFRTSWGTVGPLAKEFAFYTAPRVLSAAPYVLVPIATQFIAALITGRHERSAYQLAALLTLSLSAIASIWYYADFIHIAFIAPVFVVAAFAALQWVLSPLQRWPRGVGLIGATIAGVCVVLLAQHLQRNHARAWKTYPHRHETAFGPIDFSSKWEPVLIDATRAALAAVPGAEIFCYPTMSAPYLTTGGTNPTRYQFFDARALPKRYGDEVVQLLRQRRVEFLMISYAYLKPDDPIAQLMRAEYEAVPIPALPLTGEFPTTLLYQRKPALRAGAAHS